MSSTDLTHVTSGHVRAGDVELWYEQRGEGPDVLLIGGLSDPVESWELQLAGLSDRYRLTAFDNRGAGRSPEIPEDFTVAGMADDAAALLRALGHRVGARRRLLGRQRYCARVGAAAPRTRPQPRAAEHVGTLRPLPPHRVRLLVVDGRRRAQRASDARGVLPLGVHPSRPQRRDRRADRRGRPRVPAPAERRVVQAAAAHVDVTRDDRTCARHRRAHPRRSWWPRPHHTARAGQDRRRPHPRRRVRVAARGGSPTLPGASQ